MRPLWCMISWSFGGQESIADFGCGMGSFRWWARGVMVHSSALTRRIRFLSPPFSRAESDASLDVLGNDFIITHTGSRRPVF